LSQSKVNFNISKIKLARENAKLSINDAATACSLSVEQIQSIENGLESGFINNHFKILAIKKYITFLNLNENEVIYSDDIYEKDPDNLDQDKTNEEEAHQNSTTNKALNLFGLAEKIGIVALTFLLIFAILPKKENKEPIESFVANQVLEKPIEAESQSESIVAEQSIEINDPESLDTPQPPLFNEPNTIASFDQEIDPAPLECKNIINDSQPLYEYKTGNIPDKPSNYIHIKSNTDQTICVSSQGKNIEAFEVNESNPVTFRGTPPFLIYLDPNQSQIFFEGWIVPLNENNQGYQIKPYQDPRLGNF
jgi:transcriptional regulator with XRE-family HTH domain